MTLPCTRLIAIATLSAASTLAATTVWADSLASSASSAGSASLGSISDSIGGSSNSSGGNQKVADGDYRVIEVAVLATQPGLVRLTLAALAPAGDGAREFTLTLPERAVAAQPVAVGDVVSARQRAYGVAFARATGEAFFIALADDWRGELDARAVRL